MIELTSYFIPSCVTPEFDFPLDSVRVQFPNYIHNTTIVFFNKSTRIPIAVNGLFDIFGKRKQQNLHDFERLIVRDTIAFPDI